MFSVLDSQSTLIYLLHLLATFQINIFIKCFIYIISFYPCLASATRAGQGASSQAGFRAKSLLLSTQLPSVSPLVRKRQSSGRHFIGKPPSDKHYHVLEYILSSHYRLRWKLMGRSLTSQAWGRAGAAGPQLLWSLVFLTSLFRGLQTSGPVWLNWNIRHLGNSVRRMFLRPIHPSPVTSLPWYLKNLASSSQTLLHVRLWDVLYVLMLGCLHRVYLTQEIWV